MQGVGFDLGDLRAGAGDGLGHFQKIGAEALLGLLVSFRADHRLDALDGGQEELGIGAAVPPGRPGGLSGAHGVTVVPAWAHRQLAAIQSLPEVPET